MSKRDEILAELEYRLGPAAEKFGKAEAEFAASFEGVIDAIVQEMGVERPLVAKAAVEFMDKKFEKGAKAV